MSFRIKITVKVPDEVFNSARAVDAIAKTQRRVTAPELTNMFEETTRGWNNKPLWGKHQEIGRNRIAMQVFATGEHADQYALVNNGAAPHEIFPRNPGGMLRFRTGYSPSTRPRILRSYPFYRFGPYTSRSMVHHPGFEERAFDETIANEYTDKFAEDMQDAINSGAT